MAKTRINYLTPGRVYALALSYRLAKERGAKATAQKKRRELVEVLRAVNSSNEFGHAGSASAFKSKVRSAAKRGIADGRPAKQSVRRSKRFSLKGRSRSFILRKRKG